METTLSTNPEIMTKLDKQVTFIELRASGQSLRAIAKTLSTSKSTLSLWETELRVKIAQYKAERLRDLYNQYGILKEARIQALGEALANIDGQLAKRDLSDVPTDKLLDYKLRYTSALTEEYISLDTRDNTGQELDAKEIIRRLDDLYTRARDGETTKEQASTELIVLAGMLRAYDTSELEDKMDKLRRAISV